ncbi:hypothetical protein BJ085DRAFT_41826 [Dimargaris cristalligena]|uniref:HECT-type E3 ubiquitin transferase n=1 Tax=Dimargaris cristalligena TaxID=215637 RepID=A0A4V1J5F4_9FUNG|nr:hypothetical protein BJ085DRAFT_41826 [Dimargaris cristalligena]|eukprot:RKP38869.1 hypothetical protein BJ085DRAFT_41826 [Dimargaris cristalligena]
MAPADHPDEFPPGSPEHADTTVTFCMCCDCKLRYPMGSTCFRCTVCDTVNDLHDRDPAAAEKQRHQPLTLAVLRQALEDHRRGKLSQGQFKHLLGETFSHWDRLNHSFGNGRPTTSEDPGVALAEVRDAYRLILDLSPDYVRTMMRAIERLLRRPSRTLRHKEEVRVLVILLENPLLVQYTFPRETAYHHQITKRLLGLLSCLSNSLHHDLVRWFSQLPLALFRSRVEWVNQFITHRLTKYRRLTAAGTIRSAMPYESDWCFKAAARVMSLLFAANKLRQVSIPIPDFYNSMVDFVDLPADYDAWQQRSGQFAFCQYPTLITMGAKLQIMRLDARRQMDSKIKEALMTNILRNRQTEPFLSLQVRRQCVLEDSLNQLAARETDLKKKLHVKFADEAGVDAGGLTKEWFMLLLRDLFNPMHGMFTLDEESGLFWFNPASLETSDQYFLVGVVLGLAIYNSTILDVRFPLACYKKLHNASVGLRDLRELRPSLARGLRQLLDYPGDDIEEVFGLTFTADQDIYGRRHAVPLIPDGVNTPVTRANRGRYVRRYIDFVLNESVTRQFDPFRRGFHLVCGGNALSLFHPEEIELLVRGSSAESIDWDQLKSVTVYHGFDPEHDPIIAQFWALLESWDGQRQRQFLVFVTGSDRVPVAGTPMFTFQITCLGNGADSDRFPLGLYNYATPAKLEEKLLRAIQESGGFWLK